MLAFPTPKWQTAMLATNVANKSFAGLKAGCASLIIPRLYLSDLFTARDKKELSRLGITHVISVIEHEPTIPALIPKENRLLIGVADRPDVDILQHLDQTTEFIRNALEADPSNKVLVHCFQGVSRSATVVCAYLIATKLITGIESIEFVQGKRGIVCPNNGFRQQLEKYSHRYVGTSAKREGRGAFKLSEGIADRIRVFKSGSAAISKQNFP